MTQVAQISDKTQQGLSLLLTTYLMSPGIDQARIINIVYNPDKKIYTAFLMVDTTKVQIEVE